MTMSDNERLWDGSEEGKSNGSHLQDQLLPRSVPGSPQHQLRKRGTVDQVCSYSKTACTSCGLPCNNRSIGNGASVEELRKRLCWMWRSGSHAIVTFLVALLQCASIAPQENPQTQTKTTHTMSRQPHTCTHTIFSLERSLSLSLSPALVLAA